MKHPKDHPYMKRLDEALTHFFVLKTKDPAIHDEDYATAAKEMLDSRWATQVKGRAVKLSNAMHNGEF